MTEQNEIRLKNKLWTERYRPETLDDVIGHHEVMLRLKAFVAAGNSLEFLFSGPPASGKTTAAIAFAKDLFGDTWDRNFTELNASDERGIDVVRNKIKGFAANSPVKAAFKIIFLDEVDELCLPEGTLILTGWGGHTQHTKIEDIPQTEYIPMQSVNLETEEIEEDAGVCVDSGYADFYKITLLDGRTITASEKHPFFMSKYTLGNETGRLKEVQMKDIEPDDRIIDYSMRLHLRPDRGDPFDFDKPGLVRVIKKEFVSNGKAYNITMRDNPCFFLHNGILTHNTNTAQSALRRTIEKYSNTCRFILSCNYDNKLIAPIKSRLMCFHFAALNDDDMKTLAYKIIKAEGLTIPDEAVDLLVELSDRDTRVVINTLQVCALLSTDITIDIVRNTLQAPNKKQVLHMINTAIDGDLNMAFEICSNHIINSGFDVKKILRMIDKNLPALELHMNTKCKLLDVISDVEDRINHGGTPDIQMRALLSKFALITKVPPECPALKP